MHRVKAAFAALAAAFALVAAPAAAGHSATISGGAIVPHIACGSPVSAPIAQIYFDDCSIPYTSYIWDANVQQWEAFGAMNLDLGHASGLRYGHLFVNPVLLSPYPYLPELTFLNQNTRLKIEGAAASNDYIQEDAFGGASEVLAVRYDGTYTLQTSVQSGEELGEYSFGGFAFNDGFATICGGLRAVATENFDTNKHGDKLVFSVCPATGAAFDAATFNSDGSLTVGSPTGGACGAGCINAQALQVNGVNVLTSAGSQMAPEGTGMTGTGITAGSTDFMPCFGTGFSAAELGTATSFGLAGTFGGASGPLQLQSSSAPGVGNTYTATLRKNQADTTLTCIISGAGQSCTSGSGSVTFAATDTCSIKIVSSAGATTSRIWGGYGYTH